MENKDILTTFTNMVNVLELKQRLKIQQHNLLEIVQIIFENKLYSVVIPEIENMVKYLDEAYFKDNNPLVDDVIYDQIYHIINNSEIAYLVEKMPDDFTQRDLFSTQILQKKSHINPMLSLDKFLNNNDVNEFIKKINNYLNINNSHTYSYCVEPKIDGNSLSLVYERGKLVDAITRGDGDQGESVYHMVDQIDGIIGQLHGEHNDTYEIRGEVFIEKSNFYSINDENKKNGKKIFSNARNLVAGTLRNIHGEKLSKKLKFVPWGFGSYNYGDEKSFYKILQKLKDYGFNVSSYNKLCNTIEEALSHYEYIASIRDSIDYEIDGVVIKLDDLGLQKRLGDTNKAPRWAGAYKFQSSGAFTKIVDITLQIGRSGAITPVAELIPISVGGVMISRATLHNFDYIKSKDIRINDTVLVKRAGDVIPKIEEVDLKHRTDTCVAYEIPKICPFCGSNLIQINDNVALKCSGGIFKCEETNMKFLEHFVSKGAFNIVGLSTAQIALFVKKGLVSEPADIFKLKAEDILKLDGFAQKSVQVLLDSIQKAKEVNLDRFLYSLNIPQVGEVISKLLAKNYKTLENIINNIQNNNDTNIDGIGPFIMKDLKDFFSNKDFLNILNNLTKQVSIIDFIEEENIGFLSGKRIMFTGTMERNRQEMKDLAIKNGATILSGVSKNLDILVCGQSPGSKLLKAKEIGTIEIINEGDFLKRINF